jgi:hypothetical protein
VRREKPVVITATTPDGKKTKRGFANLEEAAEWELTLPPGTEIWTMLTYARMGWGSTVYDFGLG